jgi:integrator complex subunit 6
MIPNAKWRQDFEKYLLSIPSYYYNPLRSGNIGNALPKNIALKRYGAPPNLVPEHFDGNLNYNISNYLKKMKQQVNLR